MDESHMISQDFSGSSHPSPSDWHVIHKLKKQTPRHTQK